MHDLPTTPTWLVISRDAKDTICHLEKYSSSDDAEVRVRELRLERVDLTVSVIEHDSVIPDRTLPSEEQRQELCRVIHHIFVAMRSMGYGKNLDALTELADIVHNLPVEMYEPENWDWHSLIHDLRSFQSKYPDVQPFPLAEMISDIQNN